MKLSEFRPIGDRVALKRLEADTVTAGGILIPDIAVDKPQICVVLAIGDGENSFKFDPGDTVLIGRYSGVEVTLDGEEILVIEADDILGKFRG